MDQESVINVYNKYTKVLIVDVVNEELSHICDWLDAYKLSLNVVKTKCMLYHSINKSVEVEN